MHPADTATCPGATNPVTKRPPRPCWDCRRRLDTTQQLQASVAAPARYDAANRAWVCDARVGPAAANNEGQG